MNNKSHEERALETARNYRQAFELRFAKYSVEDKRAVAKAIVDCAGRLSKDIGRMPDNVIFGREVFTKPEVDRLIFRLRKLQEHVQEQGFEIGSTAVIALKAVAELLLLSHAHLPATVKDRRAREVEAMGQHMERLLEMHQDPAK